MFLLYSINFNFIFAAKNSAGFELVAGQIGVPGRHHAATDGVGRRFHQQHW